jgi:N-acetylneuraminic acid mutarotase
MRNSLLLMLLLVGLLRINTATGQTWMQKTSGPFIGNEGGGSFTIGQYIYFSSGKDNSFYQYDPQSGNWTQKADLPGEAKRTYQTAFAINGKGYVGLGLNASGKMKTDFWEYDPSTNVWTRKAEFIGGARIQAGSFVINSRAYVGGGADSTGTGYYSDFFEYDPSSNTWTKKAKIQAGNYSNIASQAGFSVGGFGYFVGGEKGTVQNHDVAQYDPVLDRWKKLSPLPGGNRAGAIGFSYGKFGYVGLGQIGFTTGYADFYSYDPSTDTWQMLTELPSKAGRAYAAGSVVGNTVYLGAGWDIGATELNDWWELTLPKQLPVPHLTSSVQQVNFGEHLALSTKDTTITIQAGTDTEVVISSIEIQGAGAASFLIKQKPTVPITLGVGKSLTVTVTFSPADTGHFAAALTITSNADLEATHKTSIALSGIAFLLVPKISVSSDQINFQKVTIKKSVDSVITVHAGSQTDLILKNIQLTDPSSGFALLNKPTLPFTLKAGTDLQLTVSFKPSAVTTYSATLGITSNAENESEHVSSVSLHGEGIAEAAVDNNTTSSGTGIELLLMPNPVSSESTLTLSLHGESTEAITITVEDILGNPVLTMGSEQYSPGSHSLKFSFDSMPSGKYWITARTAHGLERIPFVKVR